jgi:hypothetical protein
MNASQNGRFEIVELLIENDADVNIQENVFFFFCFFIFFFIQFFKKIFKKFQ